MIDQQNASASDIAKAIVAITLMIASCIPIAGIIPAAIVVAGFFMARKQHNFQTIITTTRWAQWLVGGVGMVITIAASNAEFDEADKISGMFLGASIVSAWIIVLEYLWMRPMTRIIEDSTTQVAKPSSTTEIIKRDSLSTYSVADELRKWRDLRDDGTVTEDEYIAARARIMK